jgi:hypothetical protein
MNARYLTALSITAFLTHLVWENAQARLFFAGYQSFFQHFPACLSGTIGDVVITFLVLGIVLLLKKEKPRTAADFLVLAVIGLVVAVAIEQHALLVGTWGYMPAMPIVPILNIGLIPILQMALLLPFSFYVAGRNKD